MRSRVIVPPNDVGDVEDDTVRLADVDDERSRLEINEDSGGRLVFPVHEEVGRYGAILSAS